MKGFVRKILLCVSLLTMMTIQVGAATMSPPNVDLLGNADGLVHVPEDDLFLYYPNMKPGDSISGTIEIKNEYDHPYELFLRANRVTDKEKYDLLSKLDLKITYKDKVIYAGPTSGENELTDDISLGVFEPNQKETLTAEVSLDGPSTGNEYKNKTAQVDWIFTALRSDDESEVVQENNDTTDRTPPAKTGDNGIGISIILGCSSVLILLLLLKRK